MPSEFRKNVPHIIAIGILLFALLIVSTKSGITRCSDFGNGYCQVYWGIFGSPTILIVHGDEGIGDPDALEDKIESIWHLPVQKLHVSKVSKPILDRYDLVIVEKARSIPTAQMDMFYNYIMDKVDGRLVWIGDSGTFGGPGDQTCRTMQFVIKYSDKASNTTNLQSKTHNRRVCVEETDMDFHNKSLYQTTIIRASSLKEAALDELKEECEFSLGGTLQLVKEENGYKCELPPESRYSRMYFDWTNEENFKNIVNPWDRGNYSLLGTENMGPGVKFGTHVLGLSFIADEFAVKNYQEYEEDLEQVRSELVIAHGGFVECSSLRSKTGCDTRVSLGQVKTDLARINQIEENVLISLSSSITELESIRRDKALSNKTTGIGLLESTIQSLREKQTNLEALDLPEAEPTQQELEDLDQFKNLLPDIRDSFALLEGSESEEALKNQYKAMREDMEENKNKLDTYMQDFETHLEEHKECKKHGTGTIQGGLVEEMGENEYERIDLLLSYASRQTTKKGVLDFMTQITNEDGLKPEWASFRNKLANIDTTKVCKGNSSQAKEGFQASVQALDLIDVASTKEVKWEALATLRVADPDHILARGISPTVELTYPIGNKTFPVPFMLVGALDTQSAVVCQLEVIPKYSERETWPAIITREPIFQAHQFGKGTVVYYAFPPETEEELVNNMVEFLLY